MNGSTLSCTMDCAFVMGRKGFFYDASEDLSIYDPFAV